MSGTPATSGTPGDSGGGARAALTPAAVEAVLGDFRAWLTDLADDAQDPGTPAPRPEPVDLFTLVGQFTALRHEVNLLTKASRAAVEQNAAVIGQLAAQAEPEPAEAPTGDALRPVVKALVDTTDALTLSLRQMEKLRDSAELLLADLLEPREVAPPSASSPGFFSRLFGSRPPAPPSAADPTRDDRAKQAADKLRQFIAAAADGYAMSLRRVERALPTLELERVSSAGDPFDPELMEAVEVVGDSGSPAGTVVEDVRPGYRWRGKVFRFAQVKVAR